MEAVLAQMRAALDDPTLNPDSPVELLKGLQRAGLQVTSTRSWELKEIEHPVIEPLLEYKRLARLLSANGWNWLDQWVHDERFRPSYVPGGVVTGRWASDGGGALQLPKQVRGAVVADEGWTFVVADAAQLEPRVLAAMSGDAAMARAGRATDMYEGMVEAGAVETRPQAKYGMLGAIYGGTTGESGRMRPRIERAFPAAMAYVEAAARAGEQGEVGQHLARPQLAARRGRGVERDGDGCRGAPGAQRGRSVGPVHPQLRRAGDGGRVGAVLDRRPAAAAVGARPADSTRALTERPHLVFFLHDELIVHTPVALAPQVAEALRGAAARCGATAVRRRARRVRALGGGRRPLRRRDRLTPP